MAPLLALSRLRVVNADVIHFAVVRQTGFLNVAAPRADFFGQLDVLRRTTYFAALRACSERLKMSSGEPSAEMETSSFRFR